MFLEISPEKYLFACLLFLGIAFVRTSAMLQHLCIDEEHDFLGDVGDVVAGTLQLAEHTEQFQAIERAVGMRIDILCQDGRGVGIDFVHQIILGED